ncbi:MAG: hypothetical protein ACK5T2_00600, partial [bacterium]
MNIGRDNAAAIAEPAVVQASGGSDVASLPAAPRDGRPSRVLLIATDILTAVGGGETVYRRIVNSHGNCQFTYFRLTESAGLPRPANATAVALPDVKRLAVTDPLFSPSRRGALTQADRYARAVANCEFDIVEVPDYQAFGALLPAAFQKHGVSYGALVVAMHGSISRAVALGWNSPGNNTLDLEALETELFRTADAVYAISPRYVAEWVQRVPRRVTCFSPLSLIEPPALVEYRPTTKRPSLYCIGRMERRKGNDLFIELVRWIRPESYHSAQHIGDTNYSFDGLSSDSILYNVAANRCITVPIRPAVDQPSLRT